MGKKMSIRNQFQHEIQMLKNEINDVRHGRIREVESNYNPKEASYMKRAENLEKYLNELLDAIDYGSKHEKAMDSIFGSKDNEDNKDN